jgi:hypothetical protein
VNSTHLRSDNGGGYDNGGNYDNYDDHHAPLPQTRSPGNDSLAMHVASAEAAVAAAEAAAGGRGGGAGGGGAGGGGGYADRYDRYASSGHDHPASSSHYDATAVPTPSPPTQTQHGGAAALGRRSRQGAASSSSKPEWDADNDFVHDSEAARVNYGAQGSGEGGAVPQQRTAATQGRRAGSSASAAGGWNNDNSISYSPPEPLQQGYGAPGAGAGLSDDHDRPPSSAAYGRRGAAAGGGGSSAPGGVRPQWEGDGAGADHTQSLGFASDRPVSNNGNRSVRTASKLAALKGRRRAVQALTSLARPPSRATPTPPLDALRQPRTLFDGVLPGGGGSHDDYGGSGGGRRSARNGGGGGGDARFDEDAPTTANHATATGNWDASGPPSEYADAEPLHPCGGCGRRFNQRALTIHSRSCKKVGGGAQKGGGNGAAEEEGDGRYGGAAAVNGRRGGAAGAGSSSPTSYGKAANNDFDPYANSNDNGNDRYGGGGGGSSASEEYNPPSRQEQATRSRRPARLQQQQSVSPPQEPDTPSPVHHAAHHQGQRGGRHGGYGGGGGGGGERQQAASVSLPPEMAGMAIPEVGRCTLTPPDPQVPMAERRLVSNLAPIKWRTGFKMCRSNAACAITPRVRTRGRPTCRRASCAGGRWSPRR